MNFFAMSEYDLYNFAVNGMPPPEHYEEWFGDGSQQNYAQNSGSDHQLPDHIECDMNGNYFCTLCGNNTMNWGNVVDHLNGGRHQRKLQNAREPSEDPQSNQLPEYIENSSNGGLLCTLCGNSNMSWDNVVNHLNGARHQNALQHAREPSEDPQSNQLPEHIDCDMNGNYFCTLCGNSNMNWGNVVDHLNGGRHQSNFQNAREPSEDPQSNQLPEHIECDMNGNYFCTLCGNRNMNWGNVVDHLNGGRHQSNLPRAYNPYENNYANQSSSSEDW